MKKKLKAFTLIELLVAMIIASIVIGFCYGSYRMVFRYYNDFRKTSIAVNKTALLHSLLVKDFSLSKKALSNNHQVAFEFYADDKRTSYAFEQNAVIRKFNGETDTFAFAVTNLSIKLFGKEINKEDHLTDNLSFIISSNDESNRFDFHKIYGADILMENDSLSLITK